MVVDASALIAILEAEPDADRFAAAIADCDRALISSATLAEAGLVMVNRHGPKAVNKVYALVHESGIQVEPVTERHARLAIEAFAKYGKGQRHKPALNYGDCFSYALAKASGMPLLFKGNDFTHPDIQTVAI